MEVLWGLGRRYGIIHVWFCLVKTGTQLRGARLLGQMSGGIVFCPPRPGAGVEDRTQAYHTEHVAQTVASKTWQVIRIGGSCVPHGVPGSPDAGACTTQRPALRRPLPAQRVGLHRICLGQQHRLRPISAVAAVRRSIGAAHPLSSTALLVEVSRATLARSLLAPLPRSGHNSGVAARSRRKEQPCVLPA